MSMDVHLSPDCEQRKHVACTGDAWDKDRDELTACTCGCHDRALEKVVR